MIPSDDLAELYQRVRRATVGLAAPLSAEDQMVQSMPNASPTKWHLAHTTWFFETFLLVPHLPGYQRVFPEADALFNSYYESVGRPRDRGQRGSLSRPSSDEVASFRQRVDQDMLRLLAGPGAGGDDVGARIRQLVILGVNHEEQHQELILTDIKHAFGGSPLFPAYRPRGEEAVVPTAAAELGWTSFAGGVTFIGHGDERAFAFDNERPRHRVLVEDFALARRLVTCGEYLEFMRDGGYRRPELWLSDGWQAARLGEWQAPLYWHGTAPGGAQTEPVADQEYWHLTLRGKQPVRMDEPVTHVSFYEADAFARWAGARLPRESEWEHAAGSELPASANLLESGRLHPAPAVAGEGLTQMFGDVWEWTQSPYVEYPGYRRPEGALGEYNGKFMCNQLILRGGSCATPRRHLRASYRNFFQPDARWQFSGIRLAKDD